MSSMDHLKDIACEAIDKTAEDLSGISREIWSNPEEGFQDYHAQNILTDYLEKKGFPVERQYVIDTGFRAIYGSHSKPNISILCEYDSLPDIGHACGHNLISEVGIGAALGIKAAIDEARDAGRQLGTV
ncbi:hypothetical protein LSH36_174g09005 [Paralvinella palmiformis]|uniref:Amidohydrolase n=1 Tax=Paralvinella palmiformis TaxID=53620 RepID=A0AAD9JS92_9ANNE|nr:hypothetical protein LSH36_174g09005 [Paralvinella palmiformis]